MPPCAIRPLARRLRAPGSNALGLLSTTRSGGVELLHGGKPGTKGTNRALDVVQGSGDVLEMDGRTSVRGIGLVVLGLRLPPGGGRAGLGVGFLGHAVVRRRLAPRSRHVSKAPAVTVFGRAARGAQRLNGGTRLAKMAKYENSFTTVIHAQTSYHHGVNC